MTRRTRIIAATLAIVLIASVAAIFILAPIARNWFNHFGAGFHQRAITTELASWERELAEITTAQQAKRGVDMLKYTSKYYTPGPGYRSDPQTEAALESQRKKTLLSIVAALETYSGEKFGLDIPKWEAWRDRQQPTTIPNSRE